MTLTKFLLARIAEDEAAGTHFEFRSLSRDGDLPKQISPTRWLAECEAKRTLLALFEAMDEWANPADADFGQKTLALPYADHPDYREEWRP